jgi:hypothetical protein
LLDTTDDLLMEMDYGVGETRNHALDQVAALVRIALGLAAKLSLDASAKCGAVVRQHNASLSPASNVRGHDHG